MEEDLVSIVVPVYNVEQYLEKSINSIINQSYKKIEIIIVNDGSTDGSLEICNSFKKKDNRIEIISKQNGGLSDARNVGIERAKGKYITFIDSDDYIDDNYVEAMISSIKENDSDICIASHRVLYPNTIIDKSTKQNYVANSKEILSKMLYDDGIDVSAWAKLYKTELLSSIKYPVGRLYEDSATTYKLIDSATKICVNSVPIYNYIVRANSIANVKFNEKKFDLIKSTEEMTDYIKSKYPELEKGCKRRLVYAYLSTLTQLARSNEKDKKAEKKLIKFIRKNGLSVLFDKKTPKRDKFGIISSFLGFKIYKFAWNTYTQLENRNVKNNNERNA